MRRPALRPKSVAQKAHRSQEHRDRQRKQTRGHERFVRAIRRFLEVIISEVKTSKSGRENVNSVPEHAEALLVHQVINEKTGTEESDEHAEPEGGFLEALQTEYQVEQ